MVLQVIWTGRALDSYYANIEYLENEWTAKEVAKFAKAVDEKIQVLQHHPYLGVSGSVINGTVRRTVINKQISLIYRVNIQQHKIELLLFWNTYRDPAKLGKDIGE